MKHGAEAMPEGLPWGPLLLEPQTASRKQGLKCQCANRAHPMDTNSSPSENPHLVKLLF